jgi:hypothetical protein
MLEYLTTATVLNSTFANNDGGLEGGAIYSYYGNPLTVTNSTFVNNHALAYAGAIGVFYGNATLKNNTFIGNTAGGFGSTILNTWGTLTMTNNIIVKGATSVNACDNDFSDGGSTNDGGGNIRFGDATCVGTTVNPLLGPLGDYGGNVPTIPLLPGSAAINAASANCPATDQRGIARGATCDSGAFESQGFTLAITAGNHQTASINTAFPIPLTVSVSSAHGEPVNGGQVVFTPPSSGAGAVLTGNPATIAIGAASVTATANGTSGAYNVTASAVGAASVDFSLTNVATPVITWANPANIVYGTPLSGTQLNATANTPGVFTYTPASGAVLTVGVHTLHVDFVPTDTVNYSNASKDVSITVTNTVPVITWGNPANIVYGTALSATQLNATADVPGTFTYTPASGAVLNAGMHTLHVDFVPTDAANYTNASKDVSITVTQVMPSITWADPADIEYGTALSGTQLNATANVPGAFTYTPAAGAYLAVGTHSLHVDFVPTDAVNYANASKDVSLTVLDHVIFTDVPDGYWAKPFIERLYLNQVTGGCGGGNYCPNQPVTRAMMAVFVLRAAHGATFAPPAATGIVFTDVPADSFAADWIEQLVAEGITGGCGGNNFCPNAPITRAQMAVFLVKAMYGAAYTPPDAVGGIFADVPADGFAAAFIEQLVADGITGGCGGGDYCPNAYVTRAEMAVFLVTAFDLP